MIKGLHAEFSLHVVTFITEWHFSVDNYRYDVRIYDGDRSVLVNERIDRRTDKRYFLGNFHVHDGYGKTLLILFEASQEQSTWTYRRLWSGIDSPIQIPPGIPIPAPQMLYIK